MKRRQWSGKCGILKAKNPSPAKIDTVEMIAKTFGISCSKLLDF